MVLATGLLVAVLVLLWRWRASHSHQHAALQAREEHLTVALWGSGEQFWDFDLERRELHLLHADETESQPGRGLSVTTRLAALPLVHPHDRAVLRRQLRSHLRGREPLLTSEYRVDSDGKGSWAWIRIRGRTVERDANGRPRRLAGTARDTSDLSK